MTEKKFKLIYSILFCWAVLVSVRVPSLYGEDYLLGEGDTLNITVIGEPNLSGKWTIRPDGKISLPLIGEVEAIRLTPSQLAAKLTRSLSEFITNPQVSVEVSEYRRRKISVIGQVKNQGAYEVRPGATVAEVLALAGGFTERADVEKVALIRSDGSNLTLDLRGFPNKLSPSQNVALEANDIVFIPETGVNSFYVLGAVRAPGAYGFRSDLTLLQALTMAGVIPERADLKRATLIHSDGKPVAVDFERLLIKGDTSQNVLLEPGDVISIPDISISLVYLLGSINRPGAYPLKESTTLVEIITMAGGLSERADKKNATLMRVDGKTQPIDFEKLLDNKDLSQNITLMPGDAIYVPESLEGLQILGGVNRPGLYPWRGKITLVEAIAQAGGTREGSKLNAVKIIRGNPESPTKITVNLAKMLDKGDVSQNVQLQPGDTVFVPEARPRPPMDFREVLGYLTGIAMLWYYLGRR